MDHLISIWLALPPKQRGPFFVTAKAAQTLAKYNVKAKDIRHLVGAKPQMARQLTKHHKGPVLSASYSNWRIVTRAGLPNPTIPHGQGGPGQGNNELWIENADKMDLMMVPAPYGTGALPGIRTFVIGGQPKLDRWLGYRPANKRPILAISFRWRDVHTAVDHYRPFLKEVKRLALTKKVDLLGHGHPLKFQTDFKQMWEAEDIKATPSFEYVLSAADVYAADCSSSSFEFVGLDRPVVFLHHPKYEDSDSFNFAPRFTQCHAGITNWEPTKLIDDALRAYEDPSEVRLARQAVALEMFGAMDGQASKRAAQILLDYYD